MTDSEGSSFLLLDSYYDAHSPSFGQILVQYIHEVPLICTLGMWQLCEE